MPDTKPTHSLPIIRRHFRMVVEGNVPETFSLTLNYPYPYDEVPLSTGRGLPNTMWVLETLGHISNGHIPVIAGTPDDIWWHGPHSPSAAEMGQWNRIIFDNYMDGLVIATKGA